MSTELLGGAGVVWGALRVLTGARAELGRLLDFAKIASNRFLAPGNPPIM